MLRGRLHHAHSFQPLARERLKEPPGESLKRFYFDTLTHDPALLCTLVDYVGADHVMLGSDYPFDMGMKRPADIVYECNFSKKVEEKILGGNITAMFRLNKKADFL